MDTNYNIRKIFTFFFCLFAFVFVFTVPVRADGESASFVESGFYNGMGGDLYSFSTTTTFSSNDVITFIFLSGDEYTDSYDNTSFSQRIIYTSSSAFDTVETFLRTSRDYPSWSDTKKTDYSGSFSSETNCYFLISPNSWAYNYNCSYSGRYVVVKIADLNDCYSVLNDYYSGKGIDGIIEDHTQEPLPVDVDTVGYLQNVTVTQLATTKDGEYLRLSFSPTTSTGLSLDASDIQYQIRTQSYFHIGDEIGKSYHNMSPLDTFRVGNYYYDFLRDDVTGDMDSQEPASTIINANFFDKKALVGIGHTQTFYYAVTFYLRPVVNGTVGGWTEVFLDGSNEDLDLGFWGSSTNNTGISDDYELTIDSSITPILPTQNPNIGFGYGNTINDAVTDSDFNFNLDTATNPIESAEDMINMITQFPTLFQRLFSFLPDWCLSLIAISFGLAAIILVVKAVRG